MLQDKSGQALWCSGERFCRLWSAWYHVHFFYSRLRYSCLYWGGQKYLHLQNLFYCIICTNSRTVSRSYNRERYFCVSFGMFSESDVSKNYAYFRCFTFRKELMVFYQWQGHICFFRRMEFISRMLQIIFHTVLYAAISQKVRVWCQLPRLRKHNQVRISLHIFLIVASKGWLGLDF